MARGAILKENTTGYAPPAPSRGSGVVGIDSGATTQGYSLVGSKVPINSTLKNAVVDTAKDFGSGMVKGYQDSFGGLTHAVESSANDISGSFDTTKNPLERVGLATRGIGKAALNVPGELIKSALSPFTQAISSTIKTTANVVGNDPAVQKAANDPAVTNVLDFFNDTSGKLSEWADAHPDAAQALSSAINIGGALLGQKQLNKPVSQVGSEIVTKVKKTADALTPGAPAPVPESAMMPPKPLNSSSMKDLRASFQKGGDVQNYIDTYDNSIAGKGLGSEGGITSEQIYKDPVKKIYTPEAAKQLISDAKSNFKDYPDLAAKFEKSLDPNNLTPQDLIDAGHAVIDEANPAFKANLETVDPTLNKKGKITSLKNSGKPGGAVKGKFGTLESGYTPETKDIAQSLLKEDGTSLVSPKANPVDNIANINEEIANVSENQIRPALRANPNPYDVKGLDESLQTIDPGDFIKGDPVLEKTYELSRKKFLDIAKKYPPTNEGLWDARIEFDKIAQKQIGSLAPTSDKVSVLKQSILDTRQGVNDFIISNTPDGQAVFGDQLKRLSNLYKAGGNIATNNYKLLNEGFIKRWIEANPKKAALIKYGGISVGVGGGGLSLLKNL